jgi:DNA adenine methylase
VDNPTTEAVLPTEREVMWTKLDTALISAEAPRRFSAEPRPFLRWAGSKRVLLPSIVTALPPRYRRYFEPFLGGGALFFLLRPQFAVLGDSCAELMSTYSAIRDDVSIVSRYLGPLKPDKKYFYSLRSNRSSGPYKSAAEFIYLNKTCWNGLYRVNSNGQFNVPYGAPKTDTIFDPGNLRACGEALNRSGIELRTGDFEETLASATTGDLVFLDPPYVTRHSNNGFVDYNEKLFSWTDQERLARTACDLAGVGASVIVTNAAHDDILDLYPGFDRVPVERSSTIASAASARGRVGEVVLFHLAEVGDDA